MSRIKTFQIPLKISYLGFRGNFAISLHSFLLFSSSSSQNAEEESVLGPGCLEGDDAIQIFLQF